MENLQRDPVLYGNYSDRGAILVTEKGIAV